MDQSAAKIFASLASPFAMGHGGRLAQARRLFPNAPEPFIDLSTGINPIPFPLPPLAEEAWTRLPEPEAIAALERRAAQAYGAPDPSMAVALPGTQILISLLPRLFPFESAGILGPTYSEYAAACARSGAKKVEAERLDGLRSARLAILCNPNNPDGRRLAPAQILHWLRESRETELAVVDEAFADFEAPPLSLVPALGEENRLLVLRSLSKSYGLAGLRLGFALAAPELARRIREALGPWQVSGPAVEIGLAALSDRAWAKAAAARLARDVGRLDALLESSGLRVLGGTQLFRLAETETEEAKSLFLQLGEAGVLARIFAERPRCLRFGLPGDEAAWQRLKGALAGSQDQGRVRL